MRVWTWVYAAVLLGLSCQAPLLYGAGGTELRWRADAAGGLELVVLYGETASNGFRFFVERFEAIPGKLQERTYSRIFTKLEAARAEFDARSAGMATGAPPALAAAVTTEVPGTEVWTPTQEWSREWERAYADWVARDADPDFLNRHGVATDCADVAYALRWIFARIHGLPAANRLAITGAMFTHASMRAEWENLPTAELWHEDSRFRAALDYLLNNTFTHTLMADSYPVKIARESIVPGAVFLTVHDLSGHTNVIRSMTLEPDAPFPIGIMASDVPRAVRPLTSYPFFRPQPARYEEAAFVKMRWPERMESGEWRLRRPTAMYDFSVEQFNPPFSGDDLVFDQAVHERLIPGFQLNVRRAFAEKTTELFQRFAARERIVADGWAVCSANPCAPGSAEYEAWSTPSRDRAIVENMVFVMRLAMRPECSNDAECVQMMETAWNTKAANVNGARPTLFRIFLGWLGPPDWVKFSSDPNDPPEVRWGIIR